MIHKFSLIAEFEYDDENGEYPVPTIRDIERNFHYNTHPYGLKHTQLEFAKGTLQSAFGLPCSYCFEVVCEKDCKCPNCNATRSTPGLASTPKSEKDNE